MDLQVRNVMIEASRASDEERMTFPEVVMKLMQAGVERYHADLVRGDKTYYLPNGESEVVAGEAVGIAPAGAFSAAGVDAAVRAIQAGKIQYRTFCNRIAEGRVRRLSRVVGRPPGRLLRPYRRQPCRMVSRCHKRAGGVRQKSTAANTAPAKSGPVSPLEAHLGYWLRFVSNQVSHSFALKVADHDVSVAEWVVLRELYECEAMAPSVLAEKIGMTRGAISKLADRLSAKTLVKRTTSDEDRRYQALALTARGRAMVPKLAALADRNDAEFFGHLTAAEQETIKAAMRGSSTGTA